MKMQNFMSHLAMWQVMSDGSMSPHGHHHTFTNYNLSRGEL